MRISKSTLIVLILIVIFSIFIANVSNLLDTQTVYDKTTNNSNVKKEQQLKITDSANHFIWFLQVSFII